MDTNRFREAVIESLEHARGTFIYQAARRDLDEKTSPEDPCGYRNWLSRLLGYCTRTFDLNNPRILDLGCGTGEFVVMMNQMGHNAKGADLNDGSLVLARILAVDNGIDPGNFVHVSDRRLPFADDVFDIITMISVLEHVDDDALAWLVPELARICHGVVFVQVPSAMKVSDDHTGLKFVPWLPRSIASRYVALRGRRYRYLISASNTWDVVYRDLSQIESCFSKHFEMQLVPSACSYPPCQEKDAVLDLRSTIRLRSFSLPIRIPLVSRYLRRATGTRIEHFYPYHNVVFRRKCA
jgi:2-polyprenyl-3-methyl-5-hydroxy-6-metoxy-1,4-benzoquinol methylase